VSAAREVGPGARTVRTDIEGLRAIAVALVVAYHLAPGALRGGFVGVDAFFVISGFLITSHLLVEEPTTLPRLGAFWGRRIRRLLPAALLVLAVTLVAVRLVAPETQWADTARQDRAAALYLVNWLLAGDAVDYLAAENDPTAVQHFWSLSVEEQFYLVWPLLIGLLLLVARRLRTRWLVLGGGLGAVVAASLAYSVHATAVDPAAAYFVTPTRIWELGIGGLLAVLVVAAGPTLGERLSGVGSATLGWLGLAGLAWAALAYSDRTPFPGSAALLPVLATALVILAHPTSDDRLGPGRLLAVRPAQWLGGVSYSVYLWHWPLVVLVPVVSGGHLGLLDGAVITVVTLVLAALTKRWVEDPFRTRRWSVRLHRSYLLAAGGMAVVTVAASLQLAEVHQVRQREEAALARALLGDDPCAGPRSLGPQRSCPPVSFDDVVPAPVLAAEDRSEAYAEVSGAEDCMARRPDYSRRHCVFGDEDGDVRVVLFGNSHATQWLPALQVLADQHHWRIDTFVAARCAAADLDQAFADGGATDACRDWVRGTAAQIASMQPDLVVLANRISLHAVGLDLAGSLPAYAEGYASVVRTIRGADVPVLMVRDTPAPSFQIPDCVAEHGADYQACDGARADWLPPEPAQQAVADLDDPAVRLVDLTDRICEGEVCHAVTGGVITYFDGSHLTATYSAMLAPYLERPIRALLDG
jgi:peptidoglycan/LPS O-acetylase OafA/YrhL